MPLQIIRNDITRVECDAIVNAANSSLLGGGGVDGAIHKAAGKRLIEECRTIGGCPAGQARVTKGYDLPCKYVIHTVGPQWIDGHHGEREVLVSCYQESLRLAKEKRCESIAFPLISTGVFGYPREEALQVAVEEISDFLSHHDMEIILVVYDQTCFQISKRLVRDIEEYIDENYVAAQYMPRSTHGYYSENMRMPRASMLMEEAVSPYAVNGKDSLEDRVNQLDESFSQMLMRKIDESGMSDSECYKKANIDRKLFSKIRSNINYQPSKTTVIAFAVALELTLAETQNLLMKAGFALSHSNKFDVIIEYFILHQNYNIYEINEALFSFDQSLLGA